MVEDRPEVEQSWYTPERVRSILRNWDAYEARSLNPASSRGLLVRGPTPEDPHLHKQRGHHGDPTIGIPTIVDIQRAFIAVYGKRGDGSLESVTVLKVSEGWSISRIAQVQQIGKERTWQAFNTASERMAGALGWVKEEE